MHKRTYISVFGINHENAGLEERKIFSLTEEELKKYLALLSGLQIENAFVLNTCNRTEVYLESSSLHKAIYSFKKLKGIYEETLHTHLFVKYDKLALEHFFEVGAGVRSKIIGDYQIIGQMRTAYKLCKEYGLIGKKFERLFQSLFASCKQIKNDTRFNHGAASHGYQLVNIIQQARLRRNSKILVLGAGDMGSKAVSHLVENGYLNITVANRTEGKAMLLQKKHGIKSSGLSNLMALIKSHPVIVSTIPLKAYFENATGGTFNEKHFFDLTVEGDIAHTVASLNGHYIGIDAIEGATQSVLNTRNGELQKVKNIIDKHLTAFNQWLKTDRKNEVFKLFEIELERFLKLQQKTGEGALPDITKRITQLFMKNYYGRLKGGNVTLTA